MAKAGARGLQCKLKTRGVRGSVWIGFKAKTHLIQRLIHLRFGSVLDDIFKKIQFDPIQFYAV